MKWFRPSHVATAVCLLLLVVGLTVMPGGVPPDPATQKPKRAASPVQNTPAVVSAAAFVDCAEAACMALTFDDGPDPRYTPKVLDILAQHKTHATFFLVGTRAAAHPDIVRRIHQEGHEIGNHSWDHANLTRLSAGEIRDQVSRTQAAIIAAGVPAPRWFRPPYGAVNAQVRAHVPLALALWNVDPEDWGKKNHHLIKDHINAHAGRGRIVDLHDMHGPTVEALPIIIQDLSGQYKLVTMSQLFGDQTGHRGEFYGR